MGASGFIKEQLGYYGNFSFGIVLIVICILYTVIFLKVHKSCFGLKCFDKNRRKLYRTQGILDLQKFKNKLICWEQRKQMKVKVNVANIKCLNQNFILNSGLLASILDIENVKSGFKTILKKRPNNYRSYILVVGKYKILKSFFGLHCNAIALYILDILG